MALTEGQSLQKYGTVAYTAWGEVEAQQDWKAKHPVGAPMPTATPTPNIPAVTPTTTPTVTPTPTATPGQPQTAQDLVSMGFYGYQGWGNAEAVADFKATSGAGKGQATGATTGAGVTGAGITGLTQAFSVTPAINLPELYKSLYASSGISDKETQFIEREKQYLEARGKISDNPFLSASMVDKRLARLQQKYEEETSPLKTEIATKKADIETQLNLQTKQFDINSSQAKMALDYFNTLLSAGALDTASGEDIASITRATGLSSTIIQSAIKANKAKNVKAEIHYSTSDSGEVTASLLDSNTGKILNQSSLGKVGNAQTGGGGSATDQKNMIIQDMQQEASRGATWDQLYKLGIGLIDARDIYGIYLTYGVWHPNKETQIADLKRYGIPQTGYEV